MYWKELEALFRKQIIRICGVQFTSYRSIWNWLRNWVCLRFAGPTAFQWIQELHSSGTNRSTDRIHRIYHPWNLKMRRYLLLAYLDIWGKLSLWNVNAPFFLQHVIFSTNFKFTSLFKIKVLLHFDELFEKFIFNSCQVLELHSQ